MSKRLNVEKVEPRRRTLKKGFTLIELLIVVVVIATLMGLVFRLAGVGGDQRARNSTIIRIQRLEFALSGYYAAFGSYPPVQLHGTRDIYGDVNDYGIQMTSNGKQEDDLSWPRVRAACLSQPVACEFPYNGKDEDMIASAQVMADSYKAKGKDWQNFSNFDILENDGDANRFGNGQKVSWQDIQVFKFGVMSFLLPRYLFMLAGPKGLYDDTRYNAQWKSQNDLKSIFSFENGKPLYSRWEDLQKDTHQREEEKEGSDKAKKYANEKYRRVLMQPSQAVCARWMQALDGIVSGGRVFYGVNTCLYHDFSSGGYHQHEGDKQDSLWMLSGIYAPGDSGKVNTSDMYMLDGMTIRDGWGMDLFYYSPPPYQGYRLWSAGPNGKTIPPWIELSDFNAKNRKTAAEWMADDIVGLSTPSN